MCQIWGANGYWVTEWWKFTLLTIMTKPKIHASFFGGIFQDAEIVACFVYLGCIDPSLHDIAELQISHHFGWKKLNAVGLNPGRITRRKGNFAWR